MARQVIAQAVTDLSHDLGNSLPPHMQNAAGKVRISDF